MKTPPPISDLPNRLARADAAWRREQARVLTWRAVPWFAGAAFVAGALDAFFQLGVGWRLALLGAGLLGAVVIAAIVAALTWWRRNPAERVARHLEMRDPALGSRVINALQLSAQAGDATVPDLTRELATQAAARAAGELAAVDFPRVSRTGADRRALGRAALAVTVVVMLAFAFLPVSTMVVPRFLDPFGDHPPYAFTRVAIAQPLADGTPVVYGGELAVRASWSGHEPRELFLTAHPPGQPGETVTVPMVRDGKNGFVASIGDVHTDLVLVAHARNRSYYSAQRLARVVLTPRIEQGWVEIAPPAYTTLRTEERKLDFKTVGALEGSALRFRLRSNRPLREGTLEVRREGVAESEPERVKLSAHGTNEVAGELPATTDARLRFRVTDIDGLVSEYSPETFLTLSHDLPPQIDIREPAQDGFASVAFVLPAKFEATDDYGVKTLRIHRALNGTYTAPLTVPVEGVQRDVTHTLAFDFQQLGARPGDRVSFFAEAIDNAPQPHLSRSRTVTMTLISEDEYNDYIREIADIADLSQKYQALADRLETLRQEQEHLAAEAKAVAERLAKEGANPSADAKAKAYELAAKQDALDAELEKLADQLGSVVRPKPVYDFERDLDKQLALEAGAVRSSAQQSQAARDATAKAGGDPAAQAAALERRAREQAERLGARREELAKDMEQPLGDLSKLHDLVNDVNLFEQAFVAQQALAEQMRAYESKSAPTREDQLAMKDIAARQAAVREVLRQLPDQLRANSEAVAKNFPKSAAGGRALAEGIEKGRLGATAQNATDRLLQSDGRNGAALTRRLSDDMAALMSQCQGGEGESKGELDQYLQAKMPGGGAGQTWQQMRQSRKFSLKGGNLAGMSNSPAKGNGTASGYSVAGDSPPPVFGSEPPAAQAAEKSGSKPGQGAGDGAPGNGAVATQSEQAQVLKGLNPTDRASGATPAELGAEEYRALVDEYFKQLTRP